VTIYRVAVVVVAESRWSMFRIERQALPSVRREWRWTMICVATEFSAGESHGRLNRRQRSQTQLRLP